MNRTHKLTTNFTMHQNILRPGGGDRLRPREPGGALRRQRRPDVPEHHPLDVGRIEPAADRSDRRVPTLRPRVHRFRGERHRAGPVPGSRDRPPIGHQHPAELPQRGPPPQRAGVGLLRDRVAQLQGRPRRPEQRAVRPVEEQRGHLRSLDNLRGPQCRAGHGQRGSGRRTQDELRLRPLRAGLLDRRSLHPQPGGALRLVQQLAGGRKPAGGLVHPRDHGGPDRGPSGLEGLERAARRGLRPVRRRPHGPQGVRRAVCGERGARHHHRLQPVRSEYRLPVLDRPQRRRHADQR